eukprot:TRINITY_DN12506_c0_g1_i1.p1 TRINITY_DN12506_c0_g1~~TRINITY_DN12506_c0_g1_i1.p1  ORF type:complete len:333 (-),score=13.22 TRINITY_DN12506_c0_g1_i1:144-1142(-)
MMPQAKRKRQGRGKAKQKPQQTVSKSSFEESEDLFTSLVRSFSTTANPKSSLASLDTISVENDFMMDVKILNNQKREVDSQTLAELNYEILANKYLDKIYEPKKRTHRPGHIQRMINNVLFLYICSCETFARATIATQCFHCYACRSSRTFRRFSSRFIRSCGSCSYCKRCREPIFTASSLIIQGQNAPPPPVPTTTTSILRVTPSSEESFLLWGSGYTSTALPSGKVSRNYVFAPYKESPHEYTRFLELLCQHYRTLNAPNINQLENFCKELLNSSKGKKGSIHKTLFNKKVLRDSVMQVKERVRSRRRCTCEERTRCAQCCRDWWKSCGC